MVALARRRKPLPKESFIVEIESLDHDGRGIAHDPNGKTIFVYDALPDETVECFYTRLFNRYDEARVIRVIRSSPDRVEPKCAHVSFCGGCSLQHVHTDRQIVNKQNALLEQFHHFGNIMPESMLPPITGKTYGYRRKARLGVRYVHKKNRVLVGFRERSGRYLADISHCPILEEPAATLFTPLSELINHLSVNEAIPQIELAIGDQGTAFVFRHVMRLTDDDLRKISLFAEHYELQIYLQPDNLDSVHRLYPPPAQNKEDELLSYFLPNQNLTLYFHPCDFVQINAEINQKMIDQVLSLLELKSTDKVLDLFSGLGNFSLPMAQIAESVCAVEGMDVMVERSQYNANKNNITNLTSIRANLTNPIEEQAWFKESYNKVLIDPPRSGAAELIPALLAKRPSHIIYVSCNPSTLARDAGELTHNGYRLAKVGVIDMFSQTTHIEAVAQFLLDE